MPRHADPIKLARAKRLLKEGWNRNRVQAATGLAKGTVKRVYESLRTPPPKK